MKRIYLPLIVLILASCKKEIQTIRNSAQQVSYLTQVYNHTLSPADTFILGVPETFFRPVPLVGGDSLYIDVDLDGKLDYLVLAHNTNDYVIYNIPSTHHQYHMLVIGLDSNRQIAVTDCLRTLPLVPDSVNCDRTELLNNGDTVGMNLLWDEKNYYGIDSVAIDPDWYGCHFGYISSPPRQIRGNTNVGLRIEKDSSVYYGFLDIRIPYFGLDTVHQLLLRKSVFNTTPNEEIRIN